MTSKAILAAAGITAGLFWAMPSWSQHEGHSKMSGSKPAVRQPASPRRPQIKGNQKIRPAKKPSKKVVSSRAGMKRKLGGGAKVQSPRPVATKPRSGMSNMKMGGHPTAGGRPGGQPMPMSHPMPMGQPRAGSLMPMAGHGDMAGAPEHSQQVLQSIDQAAGALQDAQQSTDPSRIAAALARAQRALSQARDHAVMGAPTRAKLPAGHQLPAAAAKPAAGAHEGHAVPMGRANAPASPAPKSGLHAGHQMKMSGMKMGGMSMDGMMAMQGMLTESHKHSQAALQSLDELAIALKTARQAPDRPQSASALGRAERALEAAREHLGRTQYSVELGGDLQRLESNPESTAPHLGGDHEAAPVPRTAPVPNPKRSAPGAPPEMGGTKGAPGHEGHGVAGPPAGRSQPNLQPGQGTGDSVELPSLVRGTPGMPGAPGLSGTSVRSGANTPAGQTPSSSTSGRGGSNPSGRTGGSPGGAAGR